MSLPEDSHKVMLCEKKLYACRSPAILRSPRVIWIGPLGHVSIGKDDSGAQGTLGNLNFEIQNMGTESCPTMTALTVGVCLGEGSKSCPVKSDLGRSVAPRSSEAVERAQDDDRRRWKLALQILRAKGAMAEHECTILVI